MDVRDAPAVDDAAPDDQPTIPGRPGTEVTDPPRWPWVLVGLGFFPALTFVIYAMGRVARSLTWRVDFFARHPGLAGGLVWAAALIGLAVLVAVWRTRRRPPAPSPAAHDPEPALTRLTDARRRSRNGAIVEGVAYGLMGWLMLLPAAADPLNRIAGGGDAWNVVWINWRLAEMIKSGNLVPWHIPDAIHPFGLDLRVSDGNLPIVIGTLWAVVFPPVLAFNVSLFTGVVLNMLAARRLARLFLADRLAIILVALAFATAPAIAMRTFGHFVLVFAFAGPLLIAEAIEISRGDRDPSVLRIAALLFLAYLSNIYMLIPAGLAFMVVLLFSRQPRHRRIRSLGTAALASLLTLLLMSPFIYARLQLERAEADAGAITTLSDEAFLYSGDAYSVVAQPVSSTFEVPWNPPLRDQFIPNTLEATVFPGFILLLGMAGLLFTRSRHRWALVASAAGLWVFTLGPGLSVDGNLVFGQTGWLPYQALLSVPGLGALRTPNRFSFVLAAVLTAALAIVLAAFWRRWSRQARIGALVAGAILLALNLQLPVNNAVQPTQDDEIAVLEAVAAGAEPGDTVMIVPNDCHGRVGITAGWQITHELPFVGCQGNTASLALYSEMDAYMTEPMAALRCQPEAFARRTGLEHSPTLQVLPDHVPEIRDAFGVRFLLVDKQMVAEDDFCTQRNKQPSIDSLRSWYEVVGETEQLLALDVTRGPLAGDAGLRALADDIYLIALGRRADSEELELAAGAIRDSGREGLITSLRASSVFTAVNCGERPAVDPGLLPDLAFLDLAYDVLLARDLDNVGRDNGLAFLDADGARAEVIDGIVGSEEFRGRWCGA